MSTCNLTRFNAYHKDLLFKRDEYITFYRINNSLESALKDAAVALELGDGYHCARATPDASLNSGPGSKPASTAAFYGARRGPNSTGGLGNRREFDANL